MVKERSLAAVSKVDWLLIKVKVAVIKVNTIN